MHRWTPLRIALPQPRAVNLSGRPVVVGEYTLGDLAKLDTWLADLLPDPMADLLPAVLDPDPQTRRRRLVDAWHTLEATPGLSTPDSTALLSGDEGRAVQILLATERGGKPVDAAEALELGRNATLAEWLVFDRVVWGVPAWKTIIQELDPPEAEPLMEGEVREPHDWGQSIARLIGDYGVAPSEVAGLTISQYRLLCRGGEPDWYRGPERREGETVEAWVARSAVVFDVGSNVSDGEGAEVV